MEQAQALALGVPYHLQPGGDEGRAREDCTEMKEGVGAPAEQQRPGWQSGIHLGRNRHGGGMTALTAGSPGSQGPCGHVQTGTWPGWRKALSLWRSLGPQGPFCHFRCTASPCHVSLLSLSCLVCKMARFYLIGLEAGSGRTRAP